MALRQKSITTLEESLEKLRTKKARLQNEYGPIPKKTMDQNREILAINRDIGIIDNRLRYHKGKIWTLFRLCVDLVNKGKIAPFPGHVESDAEAGAAD